MSIKRKIVVPVLAVVMIAFCLQAMASGRKGATLTGVVNINSATAEELTMLPGIGPSKAAAIVNYREAQKLVKTEDLIKVKGIGEKLFSNIQAYVTVEGPTTAKMSNDVSQGLETPTVGDDG